MRLTTLREVVMLAIILLTVLRAAEAQPAALPRIGYLADSARQASADDLRQALREGGYIEGQTITYEWRFADTPEQYPALVAELVGLPVDLLVVNTGRLALAAKAATQTIPIVMAGSADAVAQGIVASLAQPGSNVTGFTNINPDLSPRALELLKEALPGLSRVAVFTCRVPTIGPPHPVGEWEWEHLQGTAQRLGLHLHGWEVQRAEEFEARFAAAVQERAEALLVLDCMPSNNASAQVAGLAMQYRLPAVAHRRAFAAAGGFMAYGPNYTDRWRRVASYVDKILKGIKPADLPVEQPTKFNLMINLKVAQALGLTIPPTLLFQADEVMR